MISRLVAGLTLGTVVGLNILFPSSVSACEEVAYESPAVETRTYRNNPLRLEVDIPVNYRAMAMQGGAVYVTSPSDFASLQCMAREGYGSAGWFVSFIIQSQPVSNRSLSLEQLVRPQVDLIGEIQMIPTQIDGHPAVSYTYMDFHDGINILNIAFLSRDGNHLVTISGPEEDEVFQRSFRTFRFE